MEIIQNNYNPERQINYRVICPYCFSILEYELKDLDYKITSNSSHG